MVKVYSSPGCIWCVKLKDYLKSINVDFEELNVAKDFDARKEMFEISHQGGVPVINVNGKVIVGFDQQAIDEALKGK